MTGTGEATASHPRPVRILHLEDSRVDHALVKFALQRSQLANEITLVDTLEDFRREAQSGQHDIVLADYHLPGFTGLDAWDVVCKLGIQVPFVILSGAIGETAAVDACREALGAFCKSVLHVGGVGAGQVVKACNQVAVAGALLGVADALALAEAEGVDPAPMREALLGGAARSFSLEKHAPRIAAGQFTPGFRAALMRKDLRLALQGAQATSTVLPTAALAERLLDELCEGGRADWDWAALALQVRALSGKALPEHREPRA